MSKRLTIKVFKKMALKRGGECLSNDYVHYLTPLKFKCDKGHTWETKPITFRLGTWCPICADNRTKTIGEIQKIAKKRGGECLSKRYGTGQPKLRYVCAEGHNWRATASSVRNGSWCPYCTHAHREPRVFLKDIQKIAIERGGKVLSKEYLGAITKLQFQCRVGHKFEITPNSLKKGSWCRTCNLGPKSTIEDMQKLAKKYKCICLTKKFIRAKVALKWQCNKGHEWTSIPLAFKKTEGCVTCKRQRTKKNRLITS